MQWHLRFSGHDRIGFLLKDEHAPLAREVLYVEPDWTLDQQQQGDSALAVFKRK